jgi:hypothetical protein
MDIRAEVNTRSLTGGPDVYEVVVSTRPEVDDTLLYTSPVLYRNRIEAEAVANSVNHALFADRCNFCGASSSVVDSIGAVESDPTDITSYCDEQCRAEANLEALV